MLTATALLPARPSVVLAHPIVLPVSAMQPAGVSAPVLGDRLNRTIALSSFDTT